MTNFFFPCHRLHAYGLPLSSGMETPKLLSGEPKKFLRFFLQLLLGHRSTRLLFAPWRGKCTHVVSCRGVFMGVSCLRCRLHSAQCVVEGVQTCSNPILAFLNAPKPTVLYCPCPFPTQAAVSGRIIPRTVHLANLWVWRGAQF